MAGAKGAGGLPGAVAAAAFMTGLPCIGCMCPGAEGGPGVPILAEPTAPQPCGDLGTTAEPVVEGLGRMFGSKLRDE